MNFGPSFTNINTEIIPNISAITPTNGPYSPKPSNDRPFFVSDWIITTVSIISANLINKSRYTFTSVCDQVCSISVFPVEPGAA